MLSVLIAVLIAAVAYLLLAFLGLPTTVAAVIALLVFVVLILPASRGRFPRL